jgi:hypothetical protein
MRREEVSSYRVLSIYVVEKDKPLASPAPE